MSKQPRPALAQIVLAFAGIYIIWGTTFLGNALVIRSIPPFFSGATRFLLASGLMYALLRAREPRPFAGLNIGGSMLCGVLMTGMGNGFIIWSQQGLPSGICALFVAVLPVTTLILDWLFFSRRPPSYQSALGVAVGLSGVVVLTLHTHSFSGAIRPMHVLRCSPASWPGVPARCCSRAMSRRPGAQFQLPADAHRRGISAADGMPGSRMDRLRAGAHFIAVGTGVLYLVAFGSMVAVNCYAFLVAHVPAQKVTTYALVNPVIAWAWGPWCCTKKSAPMAILSAILVLAGVALILFQRRRRSARPVRQSSGRAPA
jgi:drug/metabolite transporter (DMT)-like permease